MREIEVFEGNRLRPGPSVGTGIPARLRLTGTDLSGARGTIDLDDNLLSRHMLILGGIGTGKTNTILHIMRQVRESMSRSDVMIVFDTKGDFYQELYSPGDIVISKDAKAAGPDGPDYWNIFREVAAGTSIEEDVIEITRTLFYEKVQRSNQPFFPNAARDLLGAILLHFSRSREGSEMDNRRLREFLNRSPTSDLRTMLESHEDLRALTTYIADDRSPQTQGVFSELQQMAREILIGNFAESGTLSVRKSVKERSGRAIFIEYDLGAGNLLTPIYRLLLDLAIKEALSRETSEGNVWFIIDEFRLAPNLQHIDDGANFGRSLGAKFIVGVQNVEQVFHAYGEELGRSILSGLMTTIAFNINDAATREFIKGLFGKNRKREAYMASVQTRGLIEAVRDANVVEDWDIAGLPVGRAIVGLPGEEPFLFQFDPYYS